MTDESFRGTDGEGGADGAEGERHAHVERMHREGRLDDETADRAHRLVDAGRDGELASLLRVKTVADAGSRGLGAGTVLRVLVALVAGVVLADFVIGLL